MEKIVFYILAAIIILCSVLTVTTRKILRAAVYLLFVLIATAGLYFMLNYNFLAAVQLTVYSGGVVVLIVFAVLLTAKLDHELEPVGKTKSLLAGLITSLGALSTIYVFFTNPLTGSGKSETAYDVSAIGLQLLSYEDGGYILPFEVISILLLAAMIGAIIIGKTAKKND